MRKKPWICSLNVVNWHFALLDQMEVSTKDVYDAIDMIDGWCLMESGLIQSWYD